LSENWFSHWSLSQRFCFASPCRARRQKTKTDVSAESLMRSMNSTEAIDRHGRHSSQANHERRELHNARERCWRERHQWWDEHDHRWHTDRDWNEHDHD